MTSDKLREVKQRIAYMIGMLVNGQEQSCTFSKLVGELFKSKANRFACAPEVAVMLAFVADENTRAADEKIKALVEAAKKMANHWTPDNCRELEATLAQLEGGERE